MDRRDFLRSLFGLMAVAATVVPPAPTMKFVAKICGKGPNKNGDEGKPPGEEIRTCRHCGRKLETKPVVYVRFTCGLCHEQVCGACLSPCPDEDWSLVVKHGS